jgi:hypothetical protein
MTDRGRLSPQGGGFATSRCDTPDGTYARIEITPDQSTYYLLDGSGHVSRCSASISTPMTITGEVLDIELDANADPMFLVKHAGRCHVLRAGETPSGKGAPCAAPVDLALRAGRPVILEESGLAWVWTGSKWQRDQHVVDAITLGAGDRWKALTFQGDDGYLTSAMGQVARWTAAAVQPIGAAHWPWPIGEDIAVVARGGSTFVFLLDSAGGIHQVVASPPTELVRFYPSTYYGMLDERYVDLSVVASDGSGVEPAISRSTARAPTDRSWP